MNLLSETLGQHFGAVCKQYENKVAVDFGDKQWKRTYGQLWLEGERCARCLLALGLGKGDHIGIWAANIPEWFGLMLGAFRLGIRLVPFNTAFKSRELREQVLDSDIQAFFVQPAFGQMNYLEILKEACPELGDQTGTWLELEAFPLLKTVVVFGEAEDAAFLSYVDFLRIGDFVPPGLVEKVEREVGCGDVATLLYTSGTTGKPKGAMLSHMSLLNNARIVQDSAFHCGEKDTLCLCLPFFHSFALTVGILSFLFVGATIVPIESFRPTLIFELAESRCVTFLLGVPTMFTVMTNHPARRGHDLSSLETVIIGGAPCTEQNARDIYLELGVEDVRVGYGITECSPFCCVCDVHDSIVHKTKSVGRVRDHSEIKIVDGLGRALPPGVDGEILIRGYLLMLGYYKAPKKTTAAIDADGWFHTGDQGHTDKEGFLYLTGRIKDMILRGGENIYPVELEDILSAHPAIKSISVVGVPDEKYGEEVFAFVILKDGQFLTDEEFRDHARENLSRFKVPRYVWFVERFPQNASGKIQKSILREIAKDLLEKSASRVGA